MNIGDYVRNCYGRIAKIEYIEDNIAYCDNWLTRQYEDSIDFINLDDEEDLDEIIKSSPNIIDLIEVGDYVNGHRVSNVFDEYITTEDDQITIDKENIKSIITKEQFKSMEYKVKE